MYSVQIALKEVAQKESLAEACQFFIKEIQRKISEEGGMSLMVLQGSCYIETRIDGMPCMMNFHAIVNFAHAIGLLDKKGCLRNKPAPYIPPDYARQIMIANSNDGFEAYLKEQQDFFARLADSEFASAPATTETETNLIIRP